MALCSFYDNMGAADFSKGEGSAAMSDDANAGTVQHATTIDTLHTSTSTEQHTIDIADIVIDEQFKYLLPRLSAETFAALEANMLEHGCRDPLVLWKEHNILVDGHNRYEVLKKHNLPFRIVYMDFPSRDDVIVWTIKTQIARRNLTQMQHTLFRGMHYEAEKRVHGSNRYTQENKSRHSDDSTNSTRHRLADKYNVSPRTIERDARAAAGINAIGEVSSPAKIKVLAEATDITRKQLRDLATAEPDLVAEVATAIEAGTFERESLTSTLAPTPPLPDSSDPSDSGNSSSTGQPPLPQVLAAAARALAADLLDALPADNDISSAQLETALRTHADGIEALFEQARKARS